MINYVEKVTADNVREARQVFDALRYFKKSPFLCAGNWSKKDLMDTYRDYQKIEKQWEALHEAAQAVGAEIVSYGIAPNPSGYCWGFIDVEAQKEYSKAEFKDLIEELNELCDSVPRGAI